MGQENYYSFFIIISLTIFIFIQISNHSNSKQVDRFTKHFLNHIPIYNTNEKNDTGGLGDQAYNKVWKNL